MGHCHGCGGHHWSPQATHILGCGWRPPLGEVDRLIPWKETDVDPILEGAMNALLKVRDEDPATQKEVNQFSDDLREGLDTFNKGHMVRIIAEED